MSWEETANGAVGLFLVFPPAVKETMELAAGERGIRFNLVDQKTIPI